MLHSVAAPVSTREVVRYFLVLGATGFGGPIALIGRMRKDLVDERHWVTADEFNDGVAFSQLAPGPLAAQLATYIGWLKLGVRGATASALAFVAPSFFIVLLLSAFYVRLGGLEWLATAFYGVGAAVIAIIARSAAGLAQKTLARDRLLWLVFGVNALTTVATASEILWVFLLSGCTVVLVRQAVRPLPFLPSIAILPLAVTGAIENSLASLFVFFAKASLVVFGSGLAVLPFLYGGVVETHHWLTDREFLDAVAVSMITPGPVVITVAFIGYLVAGVQGAVVAALGMFVPMFVVVVVFAPHFDRIREVRMVRHFVAGVSAAAAGALAGAAVVLAQRALPDSGALLIAAACFVALWMFKVREPVLIAASAVAALVFRQQT